MGFGALCGAYGWGGERGWVGLGYVRGMMARFPSEIISQSGIERPVGVDWLPNITGVHKAIGLRSSETIV